MKRLLGTLGIGLFGAGAIFLMAAFFSVVGNTSEDYHQAWIYFWTGGGCLTLSAMNLGWMDYDG